MIGDRVTVEDPLARLVEGKRDACVVSSATVESTLRVSRPIQPPIGHRAVSEKPRSRRLPSMVERPIKPNRGGTEMTETKKSTKRDSTDSGSGRLSDEEIAAARERARELKAEARRGKSADRAVED